MLCGQPKINAYFRVLFFGGLQIAAQLINNCLLYFLALGDIELVFILGIFQRFASRRGVSTTLV